MLKLCFLYQRIWSKHWEGQNSILYKAANFISLHFSSSERLTLKFVPELQLGKARLNGNNLFGWQCHSLHQLKVLFCKNYSSGSLTDLQGPPQYISKPPFSPIASYSPTCTKHKKLMVIFTPPVSYCCLKEIQAPPLECLVYFCLSFMHEPECHSSTAGLPDISGSNHSFPLTTWFILY